MKKGIIIVLALVMCFSLAACGEENKPTSGDASATYQQGYDDGYADGCKGESKPELSTQAPKTAKTSAQSVETPIYEDEYVVISFLGCEVDRGDEQLVFRVKNNTDGEITFQASSFAINGESLGYISGSDDIAPQSSGKVRYEADETFPTMTPETLSGVIRVIDFNKTLWGSQSYEVSFVNVEINQ